MSTHNIRGPLQFNQTTTITTGSLTITSESVVVANKTVGAATAITLPASSTTADGRRRVIYIVDGKGDAASNNITLTRAGADTINGGTTYVLAVNYGSVKLVDCGSGIWQATTFTDPAQTQTITNGTITTLTATNGAITNLTATNETVTTINATTLTLAGVTTLAANSSVAAAGSAIGNATAIALNVVHVTGADDAKGVVLPTPVAGQAYLVYSAQATNGLKVYPAVNSSINGGSANAAVVIEGKTLALFVATNATNYAGIYTANS